MSVFVLSDLHLPGGEKQSKSMEVFGRRWKDHTKLIKYAWSAMVKPCDTVIIGGDFSWAMTLAEAKDDFLFLDSLPGNKILIKGNHDYWWQSLSKNKEFLSSLGIDNVTFLQNDAKEAENLIICGTRGWYTDKEYAPDGTDYKKLMARETQRLALSLEKGKALQKESVKEIVCITHFPPVIDDFVFKEFVRTLAESSVKRVYFGHIHSKYNIAKTRTYDGIDFTITSGDYLNFVPMKIN